MLNSCLACFPSHKYQILPWSGSEVEEIQFFLSPDTIPIHQQYAFMILVIYCHQWILQELVNLILLAWKTQSQQSGLIDYPELHGWLQGIQTELHSLLQYKTNSVYNQLELLRWQALQQSSDLTTGSWIPEIEYYQKLSSHALIWPQGGGCREQRP